MNAELLLLKAEINANLNKIAEIYAELDTLRQQKSSQNRDIAVAFYLHNLYGIFENTFLRIAENFGNKIKDKSQWHSELLRRMTLEAQPLRPAVITQKSYYFLNDLRAFRHLFRNAYLHQFDPVRLDLVWQQAEALRGIYQAELDDFLTFLDALTDES